MRAPAAGLDALAGHVQKLGRHRVPLGAAGDLRGVSREGDEDSLCGGQGPPFGDPECLGSRPLGAAAGCARARV